MLGPSKLTRSFPERMRPTVSRFVHDGYYPVVVVMLMLGLTTLYHLAPPRRLPWRRGAPGAILAIVIFLAGSVALRTYITFILDHNHAYGALAAPIAALLFFYVLAFGVLYGAEFNAAIEQFSPTPAQPPRVLNPRGWQRLQDNQPTDRLPRRTSSSARRRGHPVRTSPVRTSPVPTSPSRPARPDRGPADPAQSDRWLS